MDEPDQSKQVHEASIEFEAGPIRYRASARITTAGLLAVGALVTGIILAAVPLIYVAKGPARLRAERGER